METKLRNVLIKYAVKARRTEYDELQFENLFDESACKCNHVENVMKYGKVCFKCPRAKFPFKVRFVYEQRVKLH